MVGIRRERTERPSQLGKMTSTAAAMAGGEWTAPAFVDSAIQTTV
jgi:hypothetical protein